MTREEIIEILNEDAQDFDDQALMLDGPFPGLAALRRKHAAALREAIELLRKEGAMSDKPNPGSDEARAQGCTCPILDNNHGKRAPFPPSGWWMAGVCPVHTPKEGAK